jgi:NADPH:quinone reductase-like Zn-dependent oxidoreductase
MAGVRAAVVTEFGPPEVIEIREVDDPGPPAADEVRIDVLATGVNPVDAKLRQGLSVLPPEVSLPYVTGREAAGIVSAAGEASGFAVGDPVFSLFRWSSRPGGAAEHLVVPATLVGRRPAGVPVEVAAAVPLAGTTALQTLRALDAPPGAPMVVVGASGGVGTFFVQLANEAGLEVIGIASGPNLELVESLGVPSLVDYRDADQVKALTKRFPSGARYVADLVGPAAGQLLAALVGPDTVVYTIARGTDGAGEPLPATQLDPNGADLERLGAMVAAGTMRPIVTAVHPLAEIVEAHRQLDTTHTRGKVVVTLTD